MQYVLNSTPTIIQQVRGDDNSLYNVGPGTAYISTQATVDTAGDMSILSGDTITLADNTTLYAYSTDGCTITVTDTGTVSNGSHVSIDGTVNIGEVDLAPGSTVGISGTPTVELSGTPTVNIGGQPTVALAADTSVAVTGGVSITGTPTVALADDSSVSISGDVSTTISGTPTVALASDTTVNVSGNVGISGTPTVALTTDSTVGISGDVTINDSTPLSVTLPPTTEVVVSSGTVGISGTPTVNLESGTEVGISGPVTINDSTPLSVTLPASTTVAVASGTIDINGTVPVTIGETVTVQGVVTEQQSGELVELESITIDSASTYPITIPDNLQYSGLSLILSFVYSNSVDVQVPDLTASAGYTIFGLNTNNIYFRINMPPTSGTIYIEQGDTPSESYTASLYGVPQFYDGIELITDPGSTKLGNNTYAIGYNISGSDTTIPIPQSSLRYCDIYICKSLGASTSTAQLTSSIPDQGSPVSSKYTVPSVSQVPNYVMIPNVDSNIFSGILFSGNTGDTITAICSYHS